MLYIDKVHTNKDAFAKKVKEISKLLKIKADWLMSVMKFESNLNPYAYNKISGAAGLIQFMPETRTNLNLSLAKILQISNVKQLDYVYKYLKPYAGKMKRFEDVYFAVFFPGAIGKKRNFVLRTANLPASTIARQNKPFDINKDNQITKKEVEKYLLKKLPAMKQKQNFRTAIIVLIVVLILAGTYIANRKYKFVKLPF